MLNLLRMSTIAQTTFTNNFFLNENVWISIKISLKFVPKGQFNNIPALVQIMARRRSGDKPLSESMMFRLLTHICINRPQWVKWMVRMWQGHVTLLSVDDLRYLPAVDFRVAAFPWSHWTETSTWLSNCWRRSLWRPAWSMGTFIWTTSFTMKNTVCPGLVHEAGSLLV